MKRLDSNDSGDRGDRVSRVLNTPQARLNFPATFNGRSGRLDGPGLASVREKIKDDDALKLLKENFGTDFTVDPRLIRAIMSGQCVAFIGSGFSKDVTNLDWAELIKKLVADVCADANMWNGEEDSAMSEQRQIKLQKATHIKCEFDKATQKRAGVLSLKQIAQEIEDWYGPEAFADKVASLTRIDPEKELPLNMQRRLLYLSRIPFRAIITTNYNNLLDGDCESSDKSRSNSTFALRAGNLNPDHNFEEILRPKDRTGIAGGSIRYGVDELVMKIEERDHKVSGAGNLPKTVRDAWELLKHTPILKVHGCVSEPSSIVLSQSGYKKLLHGTSSYKTFLTSLMATSTILYLGTSFSDEYLNEFRSEVLSMLRPRPVAPPAAAADLLLARLRGSAGVTEDIIQRVRAALASQSASPKSPSDRTNTIANSKGNSAQSSEAELSSRDACSSFNDPIGFDISPNFSYAKQLYFERHEGLKVMTWSTSKEQAIDLLPPAADEAAAGGGARGGPSNLAPAPDALPSRVKSGFATDDTTSSLTLPHVDTFGWAEGLSVYLHRIYIETSMSLSWGKMLHDKRVLLLESQGSAAAGTLYYQDLHAVKQFFQNCVRSFKNMQNNVRDLISVELETRMAPGSRRLSDVNWAGDGTEHTLGESHSQQESEQFMVVHTVDDLISELEPKSVSFRPFDVIISPFGCDWTAMPQKFRSQLPPRPPKDSSPPPPHTRSGEPPVSDARGDVDDFDSGPLRAHSAPNPAPHKDTPPSEPRTRRLSFSETKERLSFRRLSISSPKSDTALNSPDVGLGGSVTPDSRRTFGSVGSVQELDQDDLAGLAAAAAAAADDDDKSVDLTAEELRVLEGGSHVCRQLGERLRAEQTRSKGIHFAVPFIVFSLRSHDVPLNIRRRLAFKYGAAGFAMDPKQLLQQFQHVFGWEEDDECRDKTPLL